MTADLPTCPYCNAQVPLSAPAPAGQRLTCPRCGETFVLREAFSPDAIQAVPGVEVPRAAPVPAELPSSRNRAGVNRRVAAVVLGVMACLALAGLGFALVTQQQRRANDRGIIRKSRRPA